MYRTLDGPNPYSHYNLDNVDAGKYCRGRLFEGVDAQGNQVVHDMRDLRRRIRQNGNGNAFWNVDDDDDNDEEEE